MIDRLWKRQTAYQLTAALVAFALRDLLRQDDTNGLSSATDALNGDLTDWTVLGSRAFDGDHNGLFNDSNAVVNVSGLQYADWHLVV